MLTGAPRSISCVDRETYLLFLGGAFSEPSSSDEWSGVFYRSSPNQWTWTTGREEGSANLNCLCQRNTCGQQTDHDAMHTNSRPSENF